MSTDAGPDDPALLQARAAVRRSAPTKHVLGTIDVVDRMTALTRSRESAFRTIEALTGIRFGELQALAAVAQGADHYRKVARSTGQADAAARATVEGLVERGLLGRHADGRAPATAEPRLVHVTAEGIVALQQAEALQMRLLDAVVDTMDEDESRRLRESLEHVSAVLDPAVPTRLLLPAGAF